MPIRKATDLVIDCDPGCDDALALLMAFNSGRYDAIDILTVAGNVGVNQTTENASKVAFLAKKQKKSPEVAIYKGCAISLDGLRPAAGSVHGRDGLGDVPDSILFKNAKDRKKYIDFISESRMPQNAICRYFEIFRSMDKAVSRHLVCTGPLTNLASFLLHLGDEDHAKFWRKWKSIVIMTGALHVQGNISYHGEFNAYADPLALRIVLSSLRVAQIEDSEIPIACLVTLDITEKLNLLWDELAPIYESKNCDHIFKFVSCMLQKYFIYHGLFTNPSSRFCEKGKVVDLIKHPPPDFCKGCKKRKTGACQSVEEYRKFKKAEFMSKRHLGKTGMKQIPRFCQLHDPLALYVALNKKVETKKQNIYMSPEIGATRGRIQAVEDRQFFFEYDNTPYSSSNTTTEVKIIDVEKFMKKDKERFLSQLKSAIKMGTK